MTKKVRMVIEFNIDDEVMKEKELTPERVLDAIILADSYTNDGFEIYPSGIEGVDVASDFLLCKGRLVSKEFVE